MPPVTVEKKREYDATYYAVHRDAIKTRTSRHSRRMLYGVTPSVFRAMMRSQHRQCAICRIPLGMLDPKNVHMDHDHVTGTVRGILCHACNTGIGSLNDSVATLESATRYLKRA